MVKRRVKIILLHVHTYESGTEQVATSERVSL